MIGYFAITTAILCVLSIIVEGFVISVMALQTTARKVWSSSLLGNLASNLGLFLVLAGFILTS
jgi:membrane protein implicated in regulation of membrane protease activity